MIGTVTAEAPALSRLEREEQAMALVVKAKMHVCIYHCFYGALLERLKLRKDWRAQTMYTDAVVIGFNPDFVLSKPWEHLVYILVHEVTHCALGHPFRRGDRDPRRWNRAIDHVTNLALNCDPTLNAMFPPEGLADKRFKGMAAEEVYVILEKEDEQQQQKQQKPEQGDQEEQDELSGASNDPNSMGDCIDAGASGEPMPEDEDEDAEEESDEASDEAGDDDESDDESDGDEGDGEGDGDEEETETDDDAEAAAEDAAQSDAAGEGQTSTPAKLDDAAIEKLSREWEEAVMTAKLAAGGDIEPAVARALGQAQEVKKSFIEYVDEFAERCCAVDSSWNRPARRFETYMPSYCQPGVKRLVLAIDTSGSMDDDDLARCEVAAQHVVDDFNLKGCVVVYCDSQVRGVEHFENGEQISLANAKGGGGTRFHPALRVAKELIEQGEEIAGVIYMTDLEGTLSDAEDFADIHVLWVNTSTWQRDLEPPGGLGVVCSLFD